MEVMLEAPAVAKVVPEATVVPFVVQYQEALIVAYYTVD
jgi:hypothetical protein